MILLIGLGNPGKKYEKTRHNAGFVAINEIRKKWNFPDFEFSKKFNTEISEKNVKCQMSNVKCLLAKPQTFMNNSGTAVKKLLSYYKLKTKDLIVIHDDLDINLGKLKISTGSSAAGHNGAQSIIDALGTKKFTRIRIGIEGAELRKKRKIPGDVFVLKNFTSSETKTVQKIMDEIIFSIQKLIRQQSRKRNLTA